MRTFAAVWFLGWMALAIAGAALFVNKPRPIRTEWDAFWAIIFNLSILAAAAYLIGWI